MPTAQRLSLANLLELLTEVIVPLSVCVQTPLEVKSPAEFAIFKSLKLTVFALSISFPALIVRVPLKAKLSLNVHSPPAPLKVTSENAWLNDLKALPLAVAVKVIEGVVDETKLVGAKLPPQVIALPVPDMVRELNRISAIFITAPLPVIVKAAAPKVRVKLVPLESQFPPTVQAPEPKLKARTNPPEAVIFPPIETL